MLAVFTVVYILPTLYQITLENYFTDILILFCQIITTISVSKLEILLEFCERAISKSGTKTTSLNITH